MKHPRLAHRIGRGRAASLGRLGSAEEADGPGEGRVEERAVLVGDPEAVEARSGFPGCPGWAPAKSAGSRGALSIGENEWLAARGIPARGVG